LNRKGAKSAKGGFRPKAVNKKTCCFSNNFSSWRTWRLERSGRL